MEANEFFSNSVHLFRRT